MQKYIIFTINEQVRDFATVWVMSYFLCDCWYVSEKIISTVAERGFHTIGALKTNRMLYPFGVKRNSVSLPHFYPWHIPILTLWQLKAKITMCTGMKENLMASKMLLFFWVTRKKHLETRKHYGLFSAPMYHYQLLKSCPATYVDGQSKYFFAQRKGKQWLWLVYEVNSVVLCNFSNLLIYRY